VANCLATYGSAIDAGSCAVYLWDAAETTGLPADQSHGRLGWLLDEVWSLETAKSNPNSFALIGTAFAEVGVPSSQVVRAIENIIDGDSGALALDGRRLVIAGRE